MENDDSLIDDEPSKNDEVRPLTVDEVKAIISQQVKIKPVDMDEADQFKIIILTKEEPRLELMFNGAVNPANEALVALQNGWELGEHETVNERTKKYLITRKKRSYRRQPEKSQR